MFYSLLFKKLFTYFIYSKKHSEYFVSHKVCVAGVEGWEGRFRWFKQCSIKSSYKISCITSFLKEKLVHTQQSVSLIGILMMTEIRIFPHHFLPWLRPTDPSSFSGLKFGSHTGFHSSTSIFKPLANPVNSMIQHIQILSTPRYYLIQTIIFDLDYFYSFLNGSLPNCVRTLSRRLKITILTFFSF